MDSSLQPTQPVSVLPEKLREEYCAILRDVQKEGVGCLETRTLQSCRGRVVDEACFTQVDNFIAELWEKGDHTLWSLDCLVYTGAVCICRKVSKPKEKN